MAGRIHRFGDLELDEARLELRRLGSPVALQAKAFDLLLHLVRHRERSVRSLPLDRGRASGEEKAK